MTAVITEATPVDLARAVLERADSLTLTDGARPVIVAAITALQDAIDIHVLLGADRLSWECYDTDLAVYAEPHIVAVEKSGEDCTELADLLGEVVAKHMGPEMAEYVSNGITGETENAA